MNLIEYSDEDMLAIGLANVLVGQLENTLFNNERASFAVPGGTTPGPVFDAMSGVNLDWSRVHVLPTDERWVPEDHDAVTDVYALEPLSDELTLVSDVGLPGWTTFEARSPRISPDGRYVAFRIGQVDGTLPEPLTGGQIFVVDRDTGQVLPGSLNDQAEFGGGSALPQQTPKDALGGDLSERGEHLVYATSYGNLVKPWTGERAIVRFDRRTAGPQLSVAGLVAGGTATLTVTDAAPGGVVLLGVSNGQGPVPSYWGPLYLSPPIHSLHVPTDVAGVASFAFPVSPTSVGTALYAQGLDVLAYEPTTPWYGVVD